MPARPSSRRVVRFVQHGGTGDVRLRDADRACYSEAGGEGRSRRQDGRCEEVPLEIQVDPHLVEFEWSARYGKLAFVCAFLRAENRPREEQAPNCARARQPRDFFRPANGFDEVRIQIFGGLEIEADRADTLVDAADGGGAMGARMRDASDDARGPDRRAVGGDHDRRRRQAERFDRTARAGPSGRELPLAGRNGCGNERAFLGEKRWRLFGERPFGDGDEGVVEPGKRHRLIDYCGHTEHPRRTERLVATLAGTDAGRTIA